MTQTGGRRIPIGARMEPVYRKMVNRSPIRARTQSVVRPGKWGNPRGVFSDVRGGCARGFIRESLRNFF